MNFKMSKTLIAILISVVILFVFYTFTKSTDKEVPVPQNQELEVKESKTEDSKSSSPKLWIGQNIACQAIESASFSKDIESLRYDEWLTSKEVTGKLKPGTDKLSIKVMVDDTITFLTSASVETGATEGSSMDILVNNEYVLIAEALESDKFLDTLTISKETGMGVWQSVNAAGLPMTYEVPNSQMIYLQCVIPLDL